MTGRVENTVDKDTVLFELDNFTIHPATFYVAQTESVEQGYAVVFKQDGVVQQYSPNVEAAIHLAASGDQTLAALAAMKEAKTMADDTSGLLGDALPSSDDTVN